MAVLATINQSILKSKRFIIKNIFETTCSNWSTSYTLLTFLKKKNELEDRQLGEASNAITMASE